MSAPMALPLAALAFAVWAVYMGGLASLQADCDTELGGSLIVPGIPCSKAYRYYWFIMAWEIVVILILVAAAVSGRLIPARTAIVGLFAVATMLYIEASNTFLTAQSIDAYTEGQNEHRIRTVTAGAIMTALVNCFIILGVGSCEGPAPGHHGAAAKAAAEPVTV